MNKKYVSWIMAAILFVVLIVGMSISKDHIGKEVSYTTFQTMLKNKQVTRVVLGENDYITFYGTDDEITYQTSNPRKEGFKETLLLQDVEVQESLGTTLSMIQYVVSSMIFLGVFYLVFKKIGKNQSGQTMMGLAIKPIEADQLKEDFSHIAGNIEVKEQVQDLISFMKEPEKYTAVGARMPKGVIFYGPPGTGKTLMAKAIAKEAEVPFFSVSGSDFVELYVGVGASRVREVFAEARKHSKAVIFIDEIDAIGKKRSQSVSGSNDEKDQTLNALLTEMSGFHPDSGIVVIAATNRLELLDDALLRPGRFDRQIEIGYPDLVARKQIIVLHFKGKPISEAVNIETLAAQTVYFTGAMIENLMNEAAILAANENQRMITPMHIDQAFYRVVAGCEKKDRSGITLKEKQITAYHEAGHALVTKLLAPENQVTKVTIIPSTKGAGGFSMNVPKDKMYMTRQEVLAQIKISLAGRGAEQIVFGKEQITTGASNDIQKATRYLRDYMMKYGMDEEVGLVDMGTLLEGENFYNEKLVQRFEEKMEMLYQETLETLKVNQAVLVKLAEQLLVQETLNEIEIDQIMSERF
ncbi:MAG: ATP-dependent metallopeptidase FtsH/Yme1/Tma family protein [Cellulosilyticaceae bacterium]